MEDNFALLLKSVKDYGIFMLDVNGNIISWNEGAARIKGYNENEIIGQHFSIFYSKPDIDSGKPAMELKAAMAEGKYEEEGWRKKKDGSTFWANIIITPIFNNDNKHIGFAKITRDLTERKKFEESLKESNKKYKQLTRDLNIANLHLGRANEGLEQFASIVSHDLKEPLRKITMSADLILSKELHNMSEAGQARMKKVLQDAIRMNLMIDDILVFTSLSAIQEKEKVSLQQLIDDTTDLLEHPIKEKNVTITTDQLPEAKIIPSQFRQVFQNLISNAIKFSSPGVDPVIVVSHHTASDDELNKIGLGLRKSLVIEIKDNGIGFDPGDSEKIFGIFNRLHGKAQYPGSGVGLAICRKIIENHDGVILATAHEGQGSSFTIVIPFE